MTLWSISVTECQNRTLAHVLMWEYIRRVPQVYGGDCHIKWSERWNCSQVCTAGVIFKYNLQYYSLFQVPALKTSWNMVYCCIERISYVSVNVTTISNKSDGLWLWQEKGFGRSRSQKEFSECVRLGDPSRKMFLDRSTVPEQRYPAMCQNVD